MACIINSYRINMLAALLLQCQEKQCCITNLLIKSLTVTQTNPSYDMIIDQCIKRSLIFTLKIVLLFNNILRCWKLRHILRWNPVYSHGLVLILSHVEENSLRPSLATCEKKEKLTFLFIWQLTWIFQNIVPLHPGHILFPFRVLDLLIWRVLDT